MRKQDQLNALIRSLNKQEKRYFKLYAGAQSGDKTFMRLFDELTNSETYETEELAKKLKTSKPRLGDAKEYLQQVLLCSLRLYEQDNDPALWLNNKLQEVKILQTRNQFELAFSINGKALEKATAYENFPVLYHLLGLKYGLLSAMQKFKEQMVVRKQLLHTVEQFVEMHQLLHLNTGFAGLATSYDGAHPVSHITGEAIFKTKPQKLKSNTARIHWHEMQQNYYYYVKKDIKTAIHHNLCKLKLFEAFPRLIYSWPNSYLISLGYLSSHYGELENYNKAFQYAEKMAQETDGRRKDLPGNLRRRMNLAARSVKVYLLCYLHKFEDAVEAAGNIPYNRKEIQISHYIITQHHFAQALFFTGRFNEALKICEELQGLTTLEMKEMLFSNRVLLVMIQHALKNYSLLPYLVSSAATWAKRHEVMHPGTTEVVAWMRKLEKLSSVQEQQSFFTALKRASRENVFKDYTKNLGLTKWADDNLGI